MRRIFSIILIVLILLNVVGYYGLFVGLEYHNSQAMIQKLDAENYNDTETVTIKFPIAVPYTSDSRSYERVDGRFEHNGEYYRLVKQRLTSDTLYIVCVKDLESKHINQALVNYVKTFTDKPTESHSSRAKILNSFSKDYFSPAFSMNSTSLGWNIEVSNNTALPYLAFTFCASIVHPPERTHLG